MHILQLVGIGMIGTILVVVLRPHSPQFSMLIGILVGVILLGVVVANMGTLIGTLQQLASAAKVDHGFLSTILKIIGIAYIVEFSAQVARDAQEGALAGKIELVGKVGIVILAMPIVTDVVQSLLHLLP